jgi:hypothetical protein
MMPWADVVRLLRGEIRATVQGKSSWNIAPTHQIAIIENSNTGRHLTSARWGLSVPWSTKPMINARSETAAEKPSFREALQERRCLVPTTGFTEFVFRDVWLPRRYAVRTRSGKLGIIERPNVSSLRRPSIGGVEACLFSHDAFAGALHTIAIRLSELAQLSGQLGSQHCADL